ncbi:hypothetical protein D3C81_2059940 [compost metagenome]
MIGPLGHALIGHAAFGQIAELSGQQAEFLGQFDRLAADLLADLLDRRLDRHAGFNADQQQVQRVRKGRHDRLAT